MVRRVVVWENNMFGCLLFLRNDELILLPATARAPSVFYYELYLHWPSRMVSLLQMARCGASGTFPDVDPGDRMKIVASMRLGSLPTRTGTRPKGEEGAPTGVPPCCRDVVSAGTPVGKNLNFGGRNLAVPFQGWLSTLLTQDMSKHRWRNSLTNH